MKKKSPLGNGREALNNIKCPQTVNGIRLAVLLRLPFANFSNEHNWRQKIDKADQLNI